MATARDRAQADRPVCPVCCHPKRPEPIAGRSAAAGAAGPPWGHGLAEPGDSQGQQKTTKVEVSGRSPAIGLGRETAGVSFTAMMPVVAVAGSDPLFHG